MNISQGYWARAERVPCENANERPKNEVSLLVLHNISLPLGEFGTPYIRQLFQNQLDPRAHPSFADLEGLKVSSHALIERSGHVVQFVSFDQRAWHAGVSCYQGRENCNDFSIGIELEGTDDRAYTDAQYVALVELSLAIMAQYPDITPSRITGHEHIAPHRKTDPGRAFDWQRYFAALSQQRVK